MPSANQVQSTSHNAINTATSMDDDVDMDAPQISTLPQAEATPPPSRGSKFRVKLLVGDKKGKGKSSPPDAARKGVSQNQTQPQPRGEEEVDEEDEEDQLIDDVEPSISAPVATGTKRKAPQKKPPRPRKIDKQDKEDKKPDEPREPPDMEEQIVSAPALPEKPPPKKRAAPRKTTAASKPKIKVPPKGARPPTVPLVEDTAMSETHTITAPPSPFPVSHATSPEPEAGREPEVERPPPPPEQPGESTPLPLPVYPLPSKPFPVQPPPKIGTGFAPVQPLDRSGAKVRQWRIANREIRGIAGGRWFTRSWVGDKESDFAAALATASAATTAKVVDSDKIAVPKAVTSISAPGKSGKSKGARGSAGISTTSSRSGSIVPEPRAPKAPTKMRNIIAGPASEAGDEPEVIVSGPRGISTTS